MQFAGSVTTRTAAVALALGLTAGPAIGGVHVAALAGVAAVTDRPARGPGFASGSHYAALGDSFTAGAGSFGPEDGACVRSSGAFPALIAGRYGWTLDQQACDAATSLDVLARQTGTLTARTDAVTVTAGGNDVGFSAVVTACSLPGWIADCAGAARAAAQASRTVLPPRLAALYRGIRRKAPNAAVLAVGYPRLFGPRDCDLATFFTSDELSRINAAVDVVNGVIADRARHAGIGFLDVREVFQGHGTCTAQPWVNGLSRPLRESYHPNRAGQQVYAAQVGPALAPELPARLVMPLPGRPDRGGAPEPTLGDAAGSRLQVLARQLVEPKHLARARRLGLPRASVLRLAQALRGGIGPAAVAALLELHTLDRQLASGRH